MRPHQAYRGYCVPANLRILLISILTLLFIINVSQGYAQSQQEPGSTHAGQPVADTPAPVPIPPGGLQIGDKIPNEAWNLPLMVVNHPEGNEKITLNDYKGKLIVLDFWATWCKPCLKGIPHLFELQEQFKDDVAILFVTTQKKTTVTEFISSTKSPDIIPIKDQLFSIVEDRGLSGFFPRQTVPHTIVIDRNGIVKAITLPEFLNEDVMQEGISSDPVFALPVKAERELKDPLLKINYQGTHPPLYYSALMGYTPGFDSYGEWKVDSIHNYVRFYAKSQPILQLYLQCVLPRDFSFAKPNRRILLVKDPSRYFYHYNQDGNYTVYEPGWKKRNLFSYEAILPISFSKELVWRKMKNEIDVFFGLKSGIEKRTVLCLILKRLPGSNTAFADEKRISSNGKPLFRQKHISNLVYKLNSLRGQPLPLVLDETGYDGAISLELPDDLRNVAALQNKLREQGLNLIWERREVDMFVLREEGYEPLTKELVLTQYGYIPAELVSELPPSPSL